MFTVLEVTGSGSLCKSNGKYNHNRWLTVACVNQRFYKILTKPTFLSPSTRLVKSLLITYIISSGMTCLLLKENIIWRRTDWYFDIKKR